MNRPCRLAAALFFVSSLPLPALAASDAADSAYWDYRIPKHRWSQWTANFSGNAQQSDASGPGDQRNRVGELSGHLRTAAAGGSDSDPLFQSWLLDVSVGGSRRQIDQYALDSFGDVTGDQAARSLEERFHALYQVRAYPWAFPWGLTAGTSQQLDFYQRFESSEFVRRSPGVRQVERSSTSTPLWVYSGDFSLGTGLGRVRDVTPVYEAQVLEDRLLRSGALARPLSRSAMERLAALFTVQNEVSYAHGRPSKYFWDEVERVLIEDGVLVTGSMSLYDAHRVLEPLTIRGRIQRSAGWFFGPAVRANVLQRKFTYENSRSYLIYQADTLYFTDSYEDRFEDYFRIDGISTAVSAEYHHPAGPNWQYDIQQLTQIGESGQNLVSNTNASVMWVVTDRWLSTGWFRHTIFWDGQGLERSPGNWNVQYGADLSYFLEDRWALTLSVVGAQVHNPAWFDRSGYVSLGLNYVISGLFDAPGLTAAMRPIPGGR